MGESSSSVALSFLASRVAVSLRLESLTDQVFAYSLKHSDISFEPFPSSYAILKLNNIPETGGDTVRFVLPFPPPPSSLSFTRTHLPRHPPFILFLGMG